MLSEFKSDNPTANPAAIPGGLKRKDVRRLAMQVLYQLDMRGESDFELVAESVADSTDTADGKAFDPPELRPPAFELASGAFEDRAAADTVLIELAPEWPPHRQPPVDRAILRLAYHEMAADHAPAKVIVNESVELAKEYGSKNTAAFVNGVLDKMIKKLDKQTLATPLATEPISVSELHSESDIKPEPGTDTELGTDTEPGADTELGTDTVSGTGTDTDTDANTDSESELKDGPV